MIKKKALFGLFLCAIVTVSSCDNDDTPTVIPPATGSIIDPQVGGPDQPNQVFIDLSKGTQSAVNRDSWDLGFYTGSEFRVILNNTVSALTRSIDKTDLNAVTAQDTVGFGAQLDIDAIFSTLFGPPQPWLSETISWADDPSGDLNNTAIDEINADASANQVYIINRGKNPDGSQRGWMKIRTIRNGEGYTLQYATIGATSFQELNITKDSSVDFVNVSLDNGIAQALPEKTDWDFAFTVFLNRLSAGPNTIIPYAFNDFVITNASRVQVAEITQNDETTYEGFNLNDANGLDFSSAIDAIGSGWRTVAQPGSNQQTGVNENVFYVIRDTENNLYKLLFTRLVDPDTGERGNPQFMYDILTQ